ncbi:MAG: hypothetical protein JWN72_2660, partial [Thermoleophilia bacterium]|nr:hypothetical protein [Thermoleophilia bacterium]
MYDQRMPDPMLEQITGSLVDQFITSNGLGHLNPSDRFERFVNFSVISREYSDTFDVEEVSGPGNEVGLDGIAVVVNGALVTSAEEVNDLAARNGYVEAVFIMVSAKRSAGFAEAEVGNFGLGMLDFFGTAELPRTDFLDRSLEIKNAIYAHGALFSRGLPVLKAYYVTMGRWDEPTVIVRRISLEQQHLEALDLFESVEITASGARQLRELYFATQNPVSADFTLSQKVTLPAIPGVSEAYLGVLQASEYVRLISDGVGRIQKSLFIDNVRDFRGDDNVVNAKMAETLRSEDRNRFAVMNNGVTIVARQLRVTGDRIYIKGYQVVNGGQTSHVLFNERHSLDESVWLPIRVIGTDDEELTTAVITATNSQTPVSAQELNARSQIERDLERYLNTFEGARSLVYERRTRQYNDAPDIEKVRIVTRDLLVRAFASTFLDEPHRATGYVPSLRDQLGNRILNEDHKLAPYYTAVFAHYKLEFFWRNRSLPAEFKPGRWQILMAARHLAIGAGIGQFNSRQIETKSAEMNEIL